MATSLEGFKRVLGKFLEEEKAIHGYKSGWLCAPSSIRGNKPTYTRCWGTWMRGCRYTRVLLAGLLWAAGRRLCEQSAGLDGPLV